MSDLVVKALAYGVLGLCAICLVATLAILRREQSRAGSPRRGIVRLAAGFMVFSFALAGLGSYVQLTEQRGIKDSTARSAQLDEQIRALNKQIEVMRSAQPTADKLLTLQGRLREIDYMLKNKFRYEVENPSGSPLTLRSMVSDLRNSVRSAMNIAGGELPPD